MTFSSRFISVSVVIVLWLFILGGLVVKASHTTEVVTPLHMPYYSAQYGTFVNREPIPYALPKVDIIGSYSGENGTEDYGPLMVDINGDSLPDMLFSINVNRGYNPQIWEQYVALNTGLGFEVVYYCKQQGNAVSGHCAGGSSSRLDTSNKASALQDLWQPLYSRSSQQLRSGSVPYALPDKVIHGFSKMSNTTNDLYTPQFWDWNSDGLNDMVYSVSTPVWGTSQKNWNQYVLLNNGEGFDVVYRCVRSSNYYYGDCAL